MIIEENKTFITCDCLLEVGPLPRGTCMYRKILFDPFSLGRHSKLLAFSQFCNKYVIDFILITYITYNPKIKTKIRMRLYRYRMVYAMKI